jgi:hypothetical protein
MLRWAECDIAISPAQLSRGTVDVTNRITAVILY